MGPKECPLPLQVYNLFHPLLLNNSVLIITVSLINQSTSIIIYLLYFLIKSFTYLKKKKDGTGDSLDFADKGALVLELNLFHSTYKSLRHCHSTSSSTYK